MSQLQTSIQSGSTFIKRKFREGNYGLSCSNDLNQPRFSDNKGHIFSLFFMLRALKDDFDEIERTIILMRILSEEANGHWGYSPRGYYKEIAYNPFFVDSDDTAFALRVLKHLGIYRSAETLLAFKGNWKNSLSGFVTFINEGNTGNPDIQLSADPSIENNYAVHPEVNANIFHILLNSEFDIHFADEIITASQNPDGSWKSYFYPNEFYSTWQFMHLLALLEKRDDERFQKGLSFIIDQQQPDGSWGNPFFSALALGSLNLSEGHAEEKQKASEYLLSQQQNDGSWSYDGIIWEFHNRDGEVWRSTDSNGIITTSICVEALKAIVS